MAVMYITRVPNRDSPPAVLPDLLPGHRVADLAAILGSLFFVVGDMDR